MSNWHGHEFDTGDKTRRQRVNHSQTNEEGFTKQAKLKVFGVRVIVVCYQGILDANYILVILGVQNIYVLKGVCNKIIGMSVSSLRFPSPTPNGRGGPSGRPRPTRGLDARAGRCPSGEPPGPAAPVDGRAPSPVGTPSVALQVQQPVDEQHDPPPLITAPHGVETPASPGDR